MDAAYTDPDDLAAAYYFTHFHIFVSILWVHRTAAAVAMHCFLVLYLKNTIYTTARHNCMLSVVSSSLLAFVSFRFRKMTQLNTDDFAELWTDRSTLVAWTGTDDEKQQAQ